MTTENQQEISNIPIQVKNTFYHNCLAHHNLLLMHLYQLNILQQQQLALTGGKGCKPCENLVNLVKSCKS